MNRALILAVLLLTACSVRTDWTHPDRSAGAMYEDFKACEVEARPVSGPRARAAMRDLCMQGKGWQ